MDHNSQQRRAIEAFGQELINSGFATPDTIIGCDPEEISQVESVAPDGFPILQLYRSFLEIMGKQAGTLFRGTDLFFPRMLDSRDAAEDILGERMLPDRRFYFGDHQGYKVYFFEAGSDAVYYYQEGNPDVKLLANNFLDFLRNAWSAQHRIRESIATHDLSILDK
ncbi:SMI1/KNR4 family protein [Nocardia sp. NPDC050413]|uniref:SMI1/KNR4 family protein n=1 Tax=Nocardia sp. NPDC050413 TaxID=3155784 RepID=UPI0033C97647